MNDPTDMLVLLLMLGFFIGFRLLAGRLDHDRIRTYIKRAGGRVIEIAWNPFGPGWFGSLDRIYDVKYVTCQGKVREATCKTKAHSGVYWTGYAVPPGMNDGESVGEVADEGEAIECLKCGWSIPAGQSNCPECGWSYGSQA